MMSPENQASIGRWLWLKKLLIVSCMLAETAQMTFPKFVVQPSKIAPLSLESINPGVLGAQFAVHGEIPQRAQELSEELLRSSNPMKDFGFDYILRNNIGNPQEVGQEPITFARQIAALAEYPQLSKEGKFQFPRDVVERTEELVKANGGSIGAYSSPQGISVIRQHVADFLKERDGVSADPESIYLTAGASVGIKSMIQLLIASKNDGVMIPVPHYPLYSAALSLQKAREVEYILLEEKGWQPSLESLEKSIQDASAAGTSTKAIIVTSPGNPVGNVLSLEAMNDIISFCASHELVLMADEVYQSNIAKPMVKSFVSFRRALLNHPDENIRTRVPLVSFHSISKGQIGECGRRGGFFEIVNFPKDVKEQITKLMALEDAPVQGQIGVDVLVRPPRPGEPSYDLWYQETTAIQQTMNENAQKLVKLFKRLPSISSTEAEGAMYLYPKVELPKRALEAAQKLGKKPDTFYCLELLEKAGICVVPGSGFRQANNIFHFRTTFLGQHTDEFVRRFTKFHTEFLARYKDQ
ncbi:pyridoxal phosphate-dependent transferase [Melampsora americana]|nr:pyridoxal phosphate-dependent transferase [Melampsora americana]